MKKYIIVGVLAYAAWYFFIKEKPIKPVVVLPKIGDPIPPDANTPGTLPVISDNPQDVVVQRLIQGITAEYPNYTTAEQFQAARTKLFVNSQPQTVACLVAPCPTVAQVSKPVEDAAKALIDILDNKASLIAPSADCFFNKKCNPALI